MILLHKIMGDTNVFITALLEDWGRVYFLHDIQLKHTHTHIHTASATFHYRTPKVVSTVY